MSAPPRTADIEGVSQGVRQGPERDINTAFSFPFRRLVQLSQTCTLHLRAVFSAFSKIDRFYLSKPKRGTAMQLLRRKLLQLAAGIFALPVVSKAGRSQASS